MTASRRHQLAAGQSNELNAYFDDVIDCVSWQVAVNKGVLPDLLIVPPAANEVQREGIRGFLALYARERFGAALPRVVFDDRITGVVSDEPITALH